MEKTKKCSKCNTEFPATLEYFYKQQAGKYGLRADCKECNCNHKRLYYIDHKDKRRRRDLKFNYGITLEYYDKMFEEQKGCCKICGRHQSTLTRRLSVDHNHKTEKVRELLCDKCNLGLSYLENEEWLKIAKKYLAENNDEPKANV